MEIKKVLKSMKKSLIMTIIGIPLTFALLVLFGGLYQYDFITLVLSKPYIYALGLGIILSYIMQVFLYYDEENKI